MSRSSRTYVALAGALLVALGGLASLGGAASAGTASEAVVHAKPHHSAKHKPKKHRRKKHPTKHKMLTEHVVTHQAKPPTPTTSTMPPPPAGTETPAQQSAAGAASSDACGAAVAKPGGGSWRCSFVDDFTGSTLDGSKWLVGETSFSGFRMADTCFEADNVSVSGGALHLEAADTDDDFTCDSPTGSFTTHHTGAHVGTVGRFSQTYGRFEVRARYPHSGPGLHGGFWLYPDKLTYGAWPASGEIDVAEWWSGAANTVLPTLHYTGSDYIGDSGWGCTVADPTAWHTYTLVWEKTSIQIAIDGQTCFTRSWTLQQVLDAVLPFDKPFDLILNMAVDDTPGNEAGPSTTLPATYDVDYVKAWR